jgi:hypothetical protein
VAPVSGCCGLVDYAVDGGDPAADVYEVTFADAGKPPSELDEALAALSQPDRGLGSHVGPGTGEPGYG